MQLAMGTGSLLSSRALSQQSLLLYQVHSVCGSHYTQEKEGTLCHPTDFSPCSEPLPAVVLSWALPALPGGTVLGWSHPTALPVEPILSPCAAFLFPC